MFQSHHHRQHPLIAEALVAEFVVPMVRWMEVLTTVMAVGVPHVAGATVRTPVVEAAAAVC